MKRFLFISGSVAIGILVGAGAIYVAELLSPFKVIPTPAYAKSTIDYPTFISIMLTAVSVILAGLGFVIAILAFIGWNSIGERVSIVATSFLKEALSNGGPLHNLVKEALSNDGPLHKLVKDEVKNIVYKDITPVDIDFDDGEEKKQEGVK